MKSHNYAIYMKKLFFILLSAAAISANAQTDSTDSPLKLSGYIESYYNYDCGKPANHIRPSFLYSYNRHNEVNVNIGFVKVAYETSKVRANLALMAGTYANANLAAESGVLKNIFEANAGIKVSKTHNIWIDGGIFASHIGFEGAIGKDCWNLTRSLSAENSPYYESGAKLSYTSNDGKWFASGLLLNGWQRIQRIDGNNTPAFGHQLTFKPSDKVTLNSSSFVGSDTPDSVRLMRYFHDFYGQFQLHSKFGVILGFDIGAQQKTKGSSNYNIWYSPILIARYSPHHKVNIAARAEYYHDPNQVIIGTGTTNGFQTYGYSLNIDYLVTNKVMCRIEGRGFSSKDKIFILDNKASNKNYFITTSLAVSF